MNIYYTKTNLNTEAKQAKILQAKQLLVPPLSTASFWFSREPEYLAAAEYTSVLHSSVLFELEFTFRKIFGQLIFELQYYNITIFEFEYPAAAEYTSVLHSSVVFELEFTFRKIFGQLFCVNQSLLIQQKSVFPPQLLSYCSFHT